ncbi:MAG: hypothetical protein AAF719_12425, partial [Pseudomonadota bacterium]
LTRENFKADIEKLVRGSPVALSQKDASASVQSSSVSVEEDGPAAYTAYVSTPKSDLAETASVSVETTDSLKIDVASEEEFQFRTSPKLWLGLPLYIVLFPFLPLFLTMMAKSQFMMSKRGFETKFGGELRAIPWSAIESIEQRRASFGLAPRIIIRVADAKRFGWRTVLWTRGVKVERQQVVVFIKNMTSTIDVIAQTAIRYHQLYG